MTQPTPKTFRAQTARRIVGVLFVLLPLMLVFAFGLWEESTHPWLSPLDLDEEMLPLSSLVARSAKGMLNNIIPALPLVIGGLWLYARQISVRCLVFNSLALTSFGILLIGMFLRYSFAPGHRIVDAFWGIKGILLLGFIPTACLSALLLLLGKERYVRLCALLPLTILGSLFLLMLGS